MTDSCGAMAGRKEGRKFLYGWLNANYISLIIVFIKPWEGVASDGERPKIDRRVFTSSLPVHKGAGTDYRCAVKQWW
jgi:hypothetical protein